MKKQATLLSLMTVALVALFVAACSKGNSGGGEPAIIGPLPSCTGTNCANVVLPYGTKIGFYTQTNNFGAYYLQGGSQYSVQNDYLTVLRDAMGVCDRDSVMGGSNGGLSSCSSSWMNGFHDMVLMVDPSSQTTNVSGNVIASQGKLILRSYPAMNSNGSWYNMQLPSFSNFFYGLFGMGSYNMAGVFNPMVLQVTIWPINNDQGFEIRANGPTGSRAYGKLFQLQVATGNVLQSSSYGFQMYLNALPISSGSMVRCATPTCGLSYVP